MERRLEYIDEGRGGYVVYTDKAGTFKFFFEYGGGDCVAIIYMPKIEKWEAETKRSIAARQEILDFVATQTIKEKAPGCSYEISDFFINIWENKKSDN